MPNEPTPGELQLWVLKDINWMAGPLAQKTVTEKQKLATVFGLTAYQRHALAAPFEATARKWKPDARISRKACEDLVTAGRATDPAIA